MQLGKVLKNRRHFPSGKAPTKLIYLALHNITKFVDKPTADLQDGGQPIYDSIWEKIQINEADCLRNGATRPHNPVAPEGTAMRYRALTRSEPNEENKPT